MKGLIILVLIAVGGYYGYNYYIEHKSEVDQKISELVKRSEGTESISGIGAPSTSGDSTASTAPAAPVFESKIAAPESAAPGEKQYAPPGTFYIVDRVSVMTSNGVKAVSPGEKVKLLQRMGNGRMRVTTGDSDFEVKESQVTNDLDIARDAEKKEFVARGGKL